MRREAAADGSSATPCAAEQRVDAVKRVDAVTRVDAVVVVNVESAGKHSVVFEKLLAVRAHLLLLWEGQV